MIKTHARRKLGVLPAHRRMMLRQLATALLHHERLTTTEAKARELVSYAGRMLGRLGRLSAPREHMRQAKRWLAPNGLGVEKKLIETLLPRLAGRKGGAIRMTRLPPRSSDQAKLARVDLVS